MRPLVCAIALSACASPASSGDESSSSGAAEATGSSTATTSTSAASSEAGTAADTSTTGGESSSSGSTGEPACVLEESGPITVSRDGQVIERVHVVSTDGPAIVVDGF